jgi:hypothetical protein
MAISTPLALDSVCQFVYHGTGSVVSRTHNNKSAMLSQPVRRSACQFVYHRIMGAICMVRNNGGPILSPPVGEPTIENVAKNGMHNPYMFYKISCPYFIVP